MAEIDGKRATTRTLRFSSPFLDAPHSYTEHAALIEASPRTHNAVLTFHRLRFAAVCGAVLTYVGIGRLCGGNGVRQLLYFRALKAHFAGLSGAAMAMAVCAGLFLLLHPLATRWPRNAPVVSVALAAAAWRLLLLERWSGNWGIGASLWASLVACSFTMKAISYAAVAATAAGALLSPPPLTAPRYAEFLLLVPALRCRPSALCRAARRPRRPGRACTELAAAVLIGVATHVFLHAVMAPVLRAFAAAFACGDWPALGAALTALVVVGPVARFLLFYLHWHCVCLAFAELTGYPDRDMYGPWWVCVDDPGHFFRLWSRPVHVWLRDEIYDPVGTALRPLGGDGGGSNASDKIGTGKIGIGHSSGGGGGGSAGSVGNGGDGGGGGGKDGAGSGAGVRSSGDGSSNEGGRWRAVAAMLATFLVSSLLHELVLWCTLRRLVPVCTGNLVFGGITISIWRRVFPPLDQKPEGADAAGTAKSGGAKTARGAVDRGAAVDDGTAVDSSNSATDAVGKGAPLRRRNGGEPDRTGCGGAPAGKAAAVDKAGKSAAAAAVAAAVTTEDEWRRSGCGRRGLFAKRLFLFLTSIGETWFCVVLWSVWLSIKEDFQA